MKNEIKFNDGIIISTDNIKLNKQQDEAVKKMAEFVFDSKYSTMSLIGCAGSGKSLSIRYLARYLYQKDFCYNIVYATPTHRASFVLSDSVREDVSTIHSILGLAPDLNLDFFDAENVKFDFKNKKRLNRDNDLLIVDESSMINDELFDYIIRVCKGLNIKIIFILDKEQLMPVGQTTYSKALTDVDLTVELTKVMRTDNSMLLNEITHVRTSRSKRRFTFKTNYKSGKGIIFTDNEEKFLDMAVNMYKSDKFKNDKLYGRLAIGTNNRVTHLNGLIRDKIYNNNNEYNIGEILMGYNTFGNGFMGPSVVNSGDYEVVYVSDIINKNIYGIDTIGYNIKLKDIPRKSITEDLYILSRRNKPEVFEYLGEVFEELRMIAVVSQSKLDWQNFFKFKDSFMTPYHIRYKGIIKIPKTLDYGYCCSTHKLQGGTYNVIMVDNRNIEEFFGHDYLLCKQLKYTAISRAKELGIVLY